MVHFFSRQTQHFIASSCDPTRIIYCNTKRKIKGFGLFIATFSLYWLLLLFQQQYPTKWEAATVVTLHPNDSHGWIKFRVEMQCGRQLSLRKKAYPCLLAKCSFGKSRLQRGKIRQNFTKAVIRLRWDGFQKEIYVEKKCTGKLATSDVGCGSVTKV